MSDHVGVVEKNLCLIARSSKEKHPIEISKDSKVSELKILLARKLKRDADEIRLAFAGKIMDDDKDLKSYDLNDGKSVFYMLRYLPKKDENQKTDEKPEIDYTAIILRGYDFDELMMLNSFKLWYVLFDDDFMKRILYSSNARRKFNELSPELCDYIDKYQPQVQGVNAKTVPSKILEDKPSTSKAPQKIIGNISGVANAVGVNGVSILNTKNENTVKESTVSTQNTKKNNNNNDSTNEQRGTENRVPLPNPWISSATHSIPGSQQATLRRCRTRLRGGHKLFMARNLIFRMAKEPEKALKTIKSVDFRQFINGLVDKNLVIGRYNVQTRENIKSKLPKVMLTISKAMIEHRKLAVSCESKEDAAKTNDKTECEVANAEGADIQTEAKEDDKAQGDAVATIMNSALKKSNAALKLIIDLFEGNFPANQNNAAEDEESEDGEFVDVETVNVQMQQNDFFDQKINELTEMGFANLIANMEALIETDGDLEAAIDLLISRNQRE